MIQILRRDACCNRIRDIRRLVIGLVLILVASGIWHHARQYCVRVVASCTNDNQYLFFRSALAELDPRLVGYERININFFDANWIVFWYYYQEREPDRWNVTYGRNVLLADRNLNIRGNLAQCGYIDDESPVADADGDGLCEIVSLFHFDHDGPLRDCDLRVAVRVHSELNEVVWAVMIRHNDLFSCNHVIKTSWQDVDEDGVDELVITTQAWVMKKQWEWELGPPENLAVYEWTAPGGILEPRWVSEELDLISWTPPDGKPLKVDPSADLQSVLLDLLEVDVSTNAVP